MRQMRKIVFFNLWHNGDLHISRSLVRFIVDWAKTNNIQCEYVHNCYENVLIDIDVRKADSRYSLRQQTQTHVKDHILFFNTWYSGDPGIFNQWGVSFDCLYWSFSKVAKEFLNLELPTDYWALFPEIDYTKYHVKNASDFCTLHSAKRKILISNGRVLSGQIENFNFNPTIDYLAQSYPDYFFLITNPDKNTPIHPNVIPTSSIIKSGGCDLNENAFLSRYCDFVIGRYSGAYTFSVNRYNYQRNLKYLVFCNLYQNPLWIKSLPIRPEAQVIVSNDTQTERICGFLKDHL